MGPEKKKRQKKQTNKSAPKIVTIAYNMKGRLRFSTFVFWVSQNVAKYAYGLFWLNTFMD